MKTRSIVLSFKGKYIIDDIAPINEDTLQSQYYTVDVIPGKVNYVGSININAVSNNASLLLASMVCIFNQWPNIIFNHE